MQPLALNPPPATADAATVSAGDQLFGRYCAACHGENAETNSKIADIPVGELPWGVATR